MKNTIEPNSDRRDMAVNPFRYRTLLFRRTATATTATTGYVLIMIALLFGSALVHTPAYPSEFQSQGAQSAATVSLPSLHPIVERVLPAIVNVSAILKQSQSSSENNHDSLDESDSREKADLSGSPFDELLRRLLEGLQSRESVSLGSGFIIGPTGYIVTSSHVIDNAATITVVLEDNSRHPAKLIGTDANSDLALLKIDSDAKLPKLQWGDSDAAQVGDWVMAVGNPFGLGGTVTAGIISARGREIQSGSYEDLLQIDAPLNRGNSGGPTFNMNGEVIGINTAIVSLSGGSVGIGFAVPASVARPVIDQLREHGKVKRGWLGIETQSLTPEIANSLGREDDRGALVATLKSDSPAARAGVKQGDVILSFDGRQIERPHDLSVVVANTPVGKVAEVAVWRDGKQVELRTSVAEMPQRAESAMEEQALPIPPIRQDGALGLQFSPLTSALRRQLGVPINIQGVVVTNVAPNSPAKNVVEPGDIIQSVSQTPVASPADAEASLQAAAKSGKKNILIFINRGGSNEYVGVKLS